MRLERLPIRVLVLKRRLWEWADLLTPAENRSLAGLVYETDQRRHITRVDDEYATPVGTQDSC